MIATTVRLAARRRFRRPAAAAGRKAGDKQRATAWHLVKRTARWPGRRVPSAAAARHPAATLVLACGALLTCASVIGIALAGQTGRAATAVGTPAPLPAPRGKQAAAPQPAAATPIRPPVQITIPAIGVRAKVVRLALTAAGTLQAPPGPAVAGWYTGGPAPGAIGPAVIAGHIDWTTGPAVFFRLRLLRPGDRIYIRRSDGTLATFAVTSMHSYPKSRFPAAAVYGPVPTAQLRLITCGGTFDYATGHYLNNTVAYAALARLTRIPSAPARMGGDTAAPLAAEKRPS